MRGFTSSEDKYMFQWKKGNLRSTQYMISLTFENITREFVVEKSRYFLNHLDFSKMFLDMENEQLVHRTRTMDDFLYFSDQTIPTRIFHLTNPLAVLSIVFNEDAKTITFVGDHVVYDGIHTIQFIQKYFIDHNPSHTDFDILCPPRPNAMLSTAAIAPCACDLLRLEHHASHLVDRSENHVHNVHHVWKLPPLKEIKNKYKLSMSAVLLGKYLYHLFQQIKLPRLTVGVIVSFKKDDTNESFQNGFAMVMINVEYSKHMKGLMRTVNDELKHKQYHALASSNQMVYDVVSIETIQKMRQKVDVCFTTIPFAKSTSTANKQPLTDIKINFHHMSYPIYSCFISDGDITYGSTNTLISTLKPF